MANTLANLLLSRQSGFGLEQAFYTDDEIYQADLEAIFYRDWLFAIPACELDGPGSYTTMDIGAYNVLIVRSKDMTIRAFHNSCRHRGFKVCRQAKGRTSALVCGYHQWTYHLDGRLASARDMGQDFDKTKFGLKPIHCKEFCGLVYICLADTPPQLDEFIHTAAPYIGVHDLTNTKVAYESQIIEDGNWKLVWENNRECYHCRVNHPALAKTYSDDPDVTGIPYEGDPDSILKSHVDRLEAGHIPSRFVMCDSGQYRLSRAPLTPGSSSMTRSGKPAVARPVGTNLKGDEGTLMQFHYPSTWNHYLPDHVLLFQVMPISAKQTRLTTKWLVHKDAVEGEDYDLETLTEVWLETNEEDKQLVKLSQKGINSPAYEPGPYSPVHEDGVNQFVDWYIQTMKSRILSQSYQAAE